MNFQQGIYLVRDSFRTIGRHKGIMSLSVVIMSLTLLVLAVFLLATDNLLAVLQQTERELKVYVYLHDGAVYDDVEKTHHKLLAMPEAQDVVYISKEEALAEFQEELGEDAAVLQVLDANPLPASFRVGLKDGYRDKRSTEVFAARVAALETVEEVNYGREFLERFSVLTHIFVYIDLVLGFIVVLSAVFIMSNTVRLTILSRRRSIEILKLVGATNRFITTPFIIEGAVQGGLASLVSLVLLGVIFSVVRNMVPDVAFLSLEKSAVYVTACVLLGSLGSYASLRRWLRV